MSALRCLISFVLAAPLFAADAPVSFTRDVRPILEARCVVCHQAESGQGGVSLHSVAAMLKAKAIAPGNPEGSRLIQQIAGAKPAMPKIGGPLEAEQVALVSNWIAQGARDDSTAVAESATWWSFRPLPDSFAHESIDAYINATLAAENLTPVAPAGRRTLIRRLNYDLHGLPATPAEVEAFLADPAPDAYERLVDRLLSSPRYGERWGRHWLDAVHYGESHGYEKDKPRRHSWPYRDYVIESFNNDKPYDRFVREQLAGDHLWPADPRMLVATGFIAAGPWDYVGHAELREGTSDKKIARLLDRDDMLAQTMSTFTSLTVHCARCHDHKFDPIRQEDYYALQSVFAGVDRAEQPFDDDPATFALRRKLWFERRDVEAAMQPLLAAVRAQSSPTIDDLDARISAIGDERTDLLPKVGETYTPERIKRRKVLGEQSAEFSRQRTALARAQLAPRDRRTLEDYESRRKQIDEALAQLPKPRIVYSAATYFKRYGSFTPAWEPRPVHLLERGSVDAPLHPVEPGAVTSIEALPARFELEEGQPEGARRAALADWIVDKRNPLTWRSIVNRVWRHHFGRGLVDTPNDFGRMGEKPTHPELLDWLAADFRDHGGSLKRLHRQILLSDAYRRSTAHDGTNAAIDAGNRYLWRMNRLRLDAESVRDSVLAVSGGLDLAMGGPPAEHFFFKDDHAPIYDYARFDFESPEARRRSVYRFLIRSVQDPFMESLDCADPSLLVPKRNASLTAVQALAMLNDPLVVAESRRFAERLRNHSSDADQQISYAYELALARPPTPKETEALAEYAEKHGLENAVRLLWNSNEFLFLD